MKLKNELAWSVSRINLFRECKRKYYYRYYGSWGAWEPEATDEQKELYLLKNLTTLDIATGNKVHKIITQILRSSSQGKKFSTKGFCALFEKNFGYFIKNSESLLHRKFPKIGGLIRHEYSIPIPQEDIDESIKQGKLCIENFILSDLLKEIKSVKIDNWFFCRDFNFFSMDSIKVWAIFDFAFKNNDILKIVDFKTGKSRDSKKDVQSLNYALYFSKIHNIPLEKIEFLYHHLYPNKIDSFKFTSEDIQSIKSTIKKEYGEMKSLLTNKELNIATLDDFPKTKEINKCNYCQFRRYCEKKEGGVV